MEERKIMLVDDDQTLEFYVVEETKLNGANYLLVTDAEDDDEEGDCYILKDMSGADELMLSMSSWKMRTSWKVS